MTLSSLAISCILEQKSYATYFYKAPNALEPLVAPVEVLKPDFDALVPAQVWYQSLDYRTEDSWSCSRRLVCKLTYDATGVRRHFVVTSLSTQQVSPGQLHADYYCPRGEIENRIKEHQLDLFSDRTSTHEARKQSTAVVVFVVRLCQACKHSGSIVWGKRNWQPRVGGTIRLKLLKLYFKRS